jgi:hypothetical protein
MDRAQLRAHNARSYAKRRAAGVCCRCYSAIVGPTSAVCPACRAKRSEAYGTPQGRGRELLANVKTRAKREGVAFDLTLAWFLATWERQQGACALSRIPFDLAKWNGPGARSPYGVSIDRIVPGRGYTVDNVRLVNTFWNVAINVWGEAIALHIATATIKGRG